MQDPKTQMAGEFYVLSMLYRKGVEAFLTLGNTKSIDIFIHVNGGVRTIDVKSSKYADDWIVGSVHEKGIEAFKKKIHIENHFFVFVHFNNNREDHKVLPDCYIVPANELVEPILKITDGSKAKKDGSSKRGVNVKLGKLKQEPHQSNYFHRWDLLTT